MAKKTRRQENERQWDTIGICDSGAYAHHEYDGGSSSLSSYDTRFERFYFLLREGGIAIDKRPVVKRNRNAAVREVIAGPMVRESLPAGTVLSLWDEPRRITGKNMRLLSVDYIDLETHCARWWELGARIGVRRGDTIEWDDGTVDPIVVPEDY